MKVLRQPMQLASNLYLVYYEFPHRDSGNVFVVLGKKGKATLIDCGSESSFPQVVDNLRQLGLRPSDIEQVIATHGDYDHTQGFHPLAQRCSKIPLLLHRDDWLPAIEGDPVLTKAYAYDKPYRPLPVERCVPLSGNQLIQVGDEEMLFLHTPGHSRGSCSILGRFDGTNWLLAGDTVGGGMIDADLIGQETWEEYRKQWIESLQWLSQLEFEWVTTGHELYPVSRERFEYRRKRFGRMLYPWFELDESQASSPDMIEAHWPFLLPQSAVAAD